MFVAGESEGEGRSGFWDFVDYSKYYNNKSKVKDYKRERKGQLNNLFTCMPLRP